MNARDVATGAVVGAGGAVGALTRYAADQLVPWHPPHIPWSTLVVNVVGCLLIGALLVALTEGPVRSWWLRPFLAVGLLGGFTTFSAFAVESVRLVDVGAVGTAGAYVLVSVVGGMVAVWLASTVTRRWVVGRGDGRQ